MAAVGEGEREEGRERDAISMTVDKDDDVDLSGERSAGGVSVVVQSKPTKEAACG